MLQRFNQILLINKSEYHLILDQDYLAYAAYMKQVKRYVNVMSDPTEIWSIPNWSQGNLIQIPVNDKLFQEVINRVISS
jgi:hypothetical protein